MRSHVEGTNFQQTKHLVTKKNFENGEIQAAYERGQPRTVYTIPFTKTKVDEILFGKHPFGEDSINVTDPTDVIYYGKINGMLGIMNFRCADYTYEQFVTPEWKQFAELAIRPGGPANRKLKQEKPQFIA